MAPEGEMGKRRPVARGSAARPSRFCHVRQVRRPAVTVVVVDSTLSLHDANQPRNRNLARKRKIGLHIRAARFPTNFSIAEGFNAFWQAREFYALT